MQEPVGLGEPGGGPFDPPGAAGEIGFAGPDLGHGAGGVAGILLQAVAQAAGEVQHRFGRRVVALEQRRVAGPADLDAAKQVGLRAAQAIEPRRAERGTAENLRVRPEADRGAAPVLHRAGVH